MGGDMQKLSIRVLSSQQGSIQGIDGQTLDWDALAKGHDLVIESLDSWISTSGGSHCDLVLVFDVLTDKSKKIQIFTDISRHFPTAVRALVCDDVDVLHLNDAGLVHFSLPSNDLARALLALLPRIRLLQQLGLDFKLRTQLCQLRHLPVLPEPYLRLMRLLRAKDVDINSIVKAVKRDQVLLGKVLHAANASTLVLGHTVTDAHEAVVRLGLDRMYYLVIVVGVFVNLPKTSQFQRSRALSVAMDVAYWAAKLGTDLDVSRGSVDKCYLAGLLHNIGDLVIALVEQDDMDLSSAFDFSYGDAAAPGAFWLALWGFDSQVVNAVAQQGSLLSVDLENNQIPSLLMLAKIFEEARRSGDLAERLSQLKFADPSVIDQLLLME
jgi:HD-like signal output (HDOD) protein